MDQLKQIAPFVPVFLIGVFIIEVFRRKSASKQKPLLTCVLDTILSIPYYLEIGPWGEPNDINTAIVGAIKTTGLKDVGSQDDCQFMTRYDVARKVGMKNCKATYSPTGYWIACSVIQKRMEARLRLVDYMKKHPAVADIQMKDPVFVIGFPRTGTTFLHELLCLYPGFRSHYTWEQVDNVPGTDDESIEGLEADRALRYKKHKPRFDFIMKLAGDAIQSIHRIGYDEVEECTTPCALELPWAVSELPFVAFSCDETVALGAGETFDWYKKQLQLFTFQCKDRRDQDFTWMLKCPFHLPYLSELHKTFPECTVVWTHRDPCDCIASCCSLYETLMYTAFETPTIDRVNLGKYVMRYTKLALKMAFASLKKEASTFKVEHIRYTDTVENPKEMVKNILAKVGLEYTSEYNSLLDTYLADNAAKRAALKKTKTDKTVHAYSLEDYGLTREMVEKEFGEYIDTYKLKEVKKSK